MVKRGRKFAPSEFPVLDELSLYAAPTRGDGNCLFRALSDQQFGDESRHAEVRRNVVSYVKLHPDRFAAFVGEFGETFDQYVARLAQDAVYGGHIEIVGFAEVYNKQVVIYQADSLYVVDPQTAGSTTWDGVAHVAYHTWEHYSSVRPKAGPHDGPVSFGIPNVGPGGDSGNTTTNSAAQSGEMPRWQVEIVLRSVPDADEDLVKRMLREKDHDTVVEELIMRSFDDTYDDKANAEEPKEMGMGSSPNSNSISSSSSSTSRGSRNSRKLRGRGSATDQGATNSGEKDPLLNAAASEHGDDFQPISNRDTGADPGNRLAGDVPAQASDAVQQHWGNDENAAGPSHASQNVQDASSTINSTPRTRGDEQTRPAAADKKNRRQLARERRNQKKEAVRARKTKRIAVFDDAGGAGPGNSSSSDGPSLSSNASRIIHI